MTEALLARPDDAEALATLASVRISQQRTEDAVAALERAFAAWKDLPDESAAVPSYATRITLARLLIETERFETAIEVLERLQGEDDQLPDLWYLGGWTMFLLGEGERKKGNAAARPARRRRHAARRRHRVGDGGRARRGAVPRRRGWQVDQDGG